MRILFTGGSSFTGYWFIKRLQEAGHEVVATLRAPIDSYEGIRRARVEQLQRIATLVPGISFGTSEMIDLIQNGGPWDLLAHHAAEVTDYRSPHFDPIAALVNNSRGLTNVLDALKEGGCRHLLLTDSIFSQGQGRERGPAFSSYGLSKGLTSDLFDYYAQRAGTVMGKFVIPNPFGPFEESRFTSHLIRSWARGERPKVATPDYRRDNIHVSLLAIAYQRFAERLILSQEPLRLAPSGYVESQGSFASRVALEMERRLPWPCPIEIGVQTEFLEPLERTNEEVIDGFALGWSETKAWDDMANYYIELLRGV
jgi:UDP-glucose 4-epimerase